MELQEFVKEALAQISQGVKDAQNSVRDIGGYVNPTVNCAEGKSEMVYFGETAQGHHVFLVDFDVAISAADKTTAEGGAKLAVATFLSIGGSGGSDSESKSTSRVRFKVPLALPFDQQSMKEKCAKEQEDAERSRKSNRKHSGYMST